MLSDEVIEKVTERLINRIEQGNQYVLEQIGKKVKKIGKLPPKEAEKLIQVFKYGGDYEKIVKNLSKILNLNVKDIHKIFEEIAKNDLEFSKQFYKYRNKKFIPYKDNEILRRQVEAIAKMTADKYSDFARTKALGYSIRDSEGKIKFVGLRDVYNESIDKAVLSVIQGKSTFQDQMYSLLKNIGESGLKTLDYNGRSIRLDSMTRMHMDDSIRQLHNEEQKIIGEQFDSDGVEITVHLNPAPDHQEVQGRQFSNEEFYKFQNDIDCYSYDRKFFSHQHNGYDRRSISQYNCKHYTFSIILGVNEPQYSDEQLQDIINRNNKGFDFEGKHYSNYEGTQLQRRIETEIRKQKDLQILAKESGNGKLLYESQTKINQLNNKYKKLSEESGLLKKQDRLRVSGYKYTPLNRIEIPKGDELPSSIQNRSVKWMVDDANFDFGEVFGILSRDLEDKNVEVDSSIYQIHNKLIAKNMEQLDRLTDKYSHDAYFDKKLLLETFPSKGRTYGKAYYRQHRIALANNYFKDPQLFKEKQLEDIKSKWHYAVSDDNLDIYTLTHEYGHIVEYNYLEKKRLYYDKVGRRFDYKMADKELRDTIISNAMNKLDQRMTISEFKDKYFSDYAKSKLNYEWFAELFAKMELGEQDEFTEALKDWLGGFYE